MLGLDGGEDERKTEMPFFLRRVLAGAIRFKSLDLDLDLIRSCWDSSKLLRSINMGIEFKDFVENVWIAFIVCGRPTPPADDECREADSGRNERDDAIGRPEWQAPTGGQLSSLVEVVLWKNEDKIDVVKQI
jgi:hypothetical protein